MRSVLSCRQIRAIFGAEVGEEFGRGVLVEQDLKVFGGTDPVVVTAGRIRTCAAWSLVGTMFLHEVHLCQRPSGVSFLLLEVVMPFDAFEPGHVVWALQRLFGGRNDQAMVISLDR